MELKPGYKETEIGIIPADWNVDYIENIGHVTTGSKNTQDRIEDGDYPFFVRSQTVERINTYSFDGEAVLTAGDGVGTGKVFHYINGKFDVHQRVYRISDFSPRVNGHFFFLYFSRSFYNRIMQMTAKSSVDSVRRDMITRMIVPLPTIEGEQDAISQAIRDVDTLLDGLDRLIAKKRDLKQAAMQQLLTGKTRLPGFEGKWEKSTLGQMCSFENGDRSSNYPSPGSFRQSGIPFINAGHVADGKISTSEMNYITQEAYDRLGGGKVKAGDILFCLRGSLGKFGLVSSTFGQGAIASSLVIIRPKDAAVSREYLCCYFSSALCAQMIETWAGGAAQPNLGAKELARFSIWQPSLPEQAAIATVLSDMDAEIAALEQRRNKTKDIKQAMMQELLTGKTRLVTPGGPNA